MEHQARALVNDVGAQWQWEDAYGVPLSMHYVVANLTSQVSGRQWVAMRSTTADRARKLTVLEAGSDGDFDQKVDCEAYDGPLTLERREGVWGDWLPDGSALLHCTESSFGWSEEGILEVSGTLVGTPPRLYVPNPEVPFAWTTRWFAVTGTIDGEAVAGSAIFASVNLPTGQPLVPSPYTSEYQIAWCDFCTEFEDGTAETGLLLWGNNGFAAACVQHSDGSVLATAEVTAKAEFDQGAPAFPAVVTFSAAGEAFVWEAQEKGGRWPLRPDVAEDYRLIQGSVRREGEQRVVRRAFAYIEGYEGRF
ncbi:MAG TPA: hypothetical protein VHU88_04505 [Sporichthyaceae bacterium]|jgi:hypothetical protein|nr:hypothetical protein [Sporichthyaceae bacterium]